MMQMLQRLLVWGALGGGAMAAIVAVTGMNRSVAVSLLLAVLPFVVFAALSLFHASGSPKRTARPPRRNVLRISRTLYDNLDPEVLQLFLTDRDFTSTDYERLMQLEAFNEKKAHGASDSDIRRLPLVPMTEHMLSASKHPSCSVCLVGFELNTRVRLMPCFHHFHPGCIDPWLKEKAECPICKCAAIG